MQEVINLKPQKRPYVSPVLSYYGDLAKVTNAVAGTMKPDGAAKDVPNRTA